MSSRPECALLPASGGGLPVGRDAGRGPVRVRAPEPRTRSGTARRRTRPPSARARVRGCSLAPCPDEPCVAKRSHRAATPRRQLQADVGQERSTGAEDGFAHLELAVFAPLRQVFADVAGSLLGRLRRVQRLRVDEAEAPAPAPSSAHRLHVLERPRPLDRRSPSRGRSAGARRRAAAAPTRTAAARPCTSWPRRSIARSARSFSRRFSVRHQPPRAPRSRAPPRPRTTRHPIVPLHFTPARMGALLAIPDEPRLLARSRQRAHRDQPAVTSQVLPDLPHRVPRPRRRVARTATPPAPRHRRPAADRAAVLAASL